jgi:hypothetical protein
MTPKYGLCAALQGRRSAKMTATVTMEITASRELCMLIYT